MEKKSTSALICPECGGEFAASDLLDGDSLVTCLNCGKKFSTSEILHKSTEERVEEIRSKAYTDVEKDRTQAYRDVEEGKRKIEYERMKREFDREDKQEREAEIKAFKKGRFSKVILCFMVIFAALAVACFMNNGIIAGIIALASSGLFLIAYLFGIQVLKAGNLNLHIVAAVLAFLLIIPYCIVGADINFGDDTDYSSTFEWQMNGLFALLPEPESNNGKIVSEIEKQVHIDLYNISPDQFNEYTKECRNYGFTKEVTKNDDVFYAKDENGFDLNIFYDDKTKIMSIYIDSYDAEITPEQSTGNNQTSTNDNSDFIKGHEKAEFSRFNSLASINGLEGTRIYIECTLESTEVLEAQDTKSILAYIKDDGGNRWLIQMHFIPAVSANHYDSIIGKSIVLKGVYSGYSQAREIPVVVLDELLVKETGVIMTGMQKLLDE